MIERRVPTPNQNEKTKPMRISSITRYEVNGNGISMKVTSQNLFTEFVKYFKKCMDEDRGIDQQEIVIHRTGEDSWRIEECV